MESTISLPPFSYCCGVCNEETILIDSFHKIRALIDKLPVADECEIILVENGSRDKTPEILRSIKDKRLKLLTAPRRGLGLSYRLAIENARCPYIFLGAIDMPFGQSDLVSMSKIWPDFDLIFGSKSHPDSKVTRDFRRRLASRTYRSLLISLFKLTIGDTQGTIFLNRSRVLPFLRLCDAEDAFFMAQLAIYGQRYGLKVTEVPVVLDKEIRPSRFNLVSDSSRMLVSLLGEFIRDRDITLPELNQRSL